ncbi:ABC transporter ATP-binding protein [Ottowia thiooxydans]|uniref:ABC-type oligopeptide transport system ATPase subunit n=1 Tax=Ottowia thiooxydans TaxID=219182 RepID=A0ABV2QAZ6_9BURK
MSHDFLEVISLSKNFDLGRGQILKAVQNVTFSAAKGKVIGLVGESGSGKSTLVRMIARLIPQSSGEVLLDRINISPLVGSTFSRHPARRDIQMVFQDPLASLNPRFRARRAIADPVLRLGTEAEKARVDELVEQAATRTGLPTELLDRFPHELSGGQRARVDIARAIVLTPKLVILDEPTSALDASLQAHVVRTLMALRDELDLTYIFVSHDLNLVRLLADEIIVMYQGQAVEQGDTQQVFHDPSNDYTKTLLAALPHMPSQRW